VLSYRIASCLAESNEHYSSVYAEALGVRGRVTEGLDVRRVFVRDLDQVWYQRGIRGLGDTPESAAEALRAENGPHPVRPVGNSAGGVGAIWFGAMPLEIDRPYRALAPCPPSSVLTLGPPGAPWAATAGTCGWVCCA